MLLKCKLSLFKKGFFNNLLQLYIKGIQVRNDNLKKLYSPKSWIEIWLLHLYSCNICKGKAKKRFWLLYLWFKKGLFFSPSQIYLKVQLETNCQQKVFLTKKKKLFKYFICKSFFVNMKKTSSKILDGMKKINWFNPKNSWGWKSNYSFNDYTLEHSKKQKLLR